MDDELPPPQPGVELGGFLSLDGSLPQAEGDRLALEGWEIYGEYVPGPGSAARVFKLRRFRRPSDAAPVEE